MLTVPLACQVDTCGQVQYASAPQYFFQGLPRSDEPLPNPSLPVPHRWHTLKAAQRANHSSTLVATGRVASSSAAPSWPVLRHNATDSWQGAHDESHHVGICCTSSHLISPACSTSLACNGCIRHLLMDSTFQQGSGYMCWCLSNGPTTLLRALDRTLRPGRNPSPAGQLCQAWPLPSSFTEMRLTYHKTYLQFAQVCTRCQQCHP